MRSLAVSAVVAALAIACVRPNAAVAGSAVIFMYHHVDATTPESTSVTPARFREQMDLLESGGYTVVPLQELLDALQSGTELPAKSVALTFDDAYESVLLEAMPVLRARGWPFTVFVSTEAVDQQFRGYLSWDQLRELTQNGATIGNHSVSHAHLVRKNPGESDRDWLQRVQTEIDAAAARLRDELGAALIPAFAYPYGEYTDEIRVLLAERQLAGLGQHSGAIGQGSDLQALARYPVAASLALDEFALRAGSLALPARVVGTIGPIVQGQDLRPVLELEIEANSDIRMDEIACYASSQGRMEIEWINRDRRHFSVQPEMALQPGRNKYNCTAPSREHSGTYYWFSYLWMTKLPDGSWYEE